MKKKRKMFTVALLVSIIGLSSMSVYAKENNENTNMVEPQFKTANVIDLEETVSDVSEAIDYNIMDRTYSGTVPEILNVPGEANAETYADNENTDPN